MDGSPACPGDALAAAGFDEQLNLYGGVEGQLCDTDGRAGVPSRIPENLHQKIAGSVGDLGLVVKAGVGAHEDADPHDLGDLVDPTSDLGGGGDRIEYGDSGPVRGVLKRYFAGYFPGVDQAAVSEWQLPAGVDVMARAVGGNVAAHRGRCAG